MKKGVEKEGRKRSGSHFDDMGFKGGSSAACWMLGIITTDYINCCWGVSGSLSVLVSRDAVMGGQRRGQEEERRRGGEEGQKINDDLWKIE